MKNGFIIARGMYDTSKLFEYTKTRIDEPYKADMQSPGTPSFYGDIELKKLQIKLMPKIEELTGLKLYPTYNYFRIYNKKSILKKHADRHACEISITMNIGYEGDYNWPICIRGNDGEDYSVELEPGDGLIYKGCDNTHWRNSSRGKVKKQSQVFMHYVDQNGPYENLIFDINR